MRNREIFRAQHDAALTIVVEYGISEVDRSKGLNVLVNSDRVLRAFNPSDVTAWFQRSSIANLKGWQDAYHRCGLGGADFARPEAFKPVLEVPYFTQRDNTRSPGGTCNVTSYAMDLTFLGAKRKYAYLFDQFEDELSWMLEQNQRDRHSHEDLAWMGRQYGMNARFNVNRTFEQIRAEIRAGFPVVVSGTFTRAGHIVVLVGLQGQDFVANDPWGDALSRYRDHNGNHVVYPLAYLRDTIRGGSNAKWAHFIRPKS